MPPLTRQGNPALTREQLLQILFGPLVAANVILASGVRIEDAPTAVPLKVPKITDVPAAGWYSEGETIADSDAPTDFLTLLDAGLRSVKVWLPMSSEIIRNSPLGLDDAFRAQLVFSVSRELEKAFINGDPTPDVDGNHNPEGILRWAGTQELDMLGGNPGLDDFAAMITLLENAFAVPSVWLMSPSMWNHVRTTKDTLERYQLNPAPGGDTTKSLFGIPVTTSPYLAEATGNESSVILMDASYVIVARDNAPEARLFTETLAQQDSVALRVTTRMDIGPIWSQAVAIMRNATHVVAP